MNSLAAKLAALKAAALPPVEPLQTVEPIISETHATPEPTTSRPSSFAARLAQLRQAQQGFQPPEPLTQAGNPNLPVDSAEPSLEMAPIMIGGYPLNDKQMLAVSLTTKGQSFVLTGAAGTGKTTAQAGVVQALDKMGAFTTVEFKSIGSAPSIAIVAFTKVAVRNIQKAIRRIPEIAHYAKQCMTVHQFLEFEPETVTKYNDEGMPYDVMNFTPRRNAMNPIEVTHLIIEEASMVGVEPLGRQLFEALVPGVQIIYLGDINQLQPVFSKPLLGYALVKLPVIELDHVYRQALDSPIIFNAHEVLKGNPIRSSKDGKVAVVVGSGKEQTGALKMSMAFVGFMRNMLNAGRYDPEQDIILLPWNKKELGTKAINEAIATYLGQMRDAVVYEVRTTYMAWWLAVGDKVLVDKRQGRIVGIKTNPKWIGAACATPGSYTRNGMPIYGSAAGIDFEESAEHSTLPDYGDIDMSTVSDEDGGSRAASHIVSVEWDDMPGTISELKSSGEFRDEVFQFGYAMTVHKAQGSEWRNVFMAIHKDHKISLSREMMYTALTRARESFTILCKEDVLEYACSRQAIKGQSLADKIEYFNSGALADLDTVMVEKPL